MKLHGEEVKVGDKVWHMIKGWGEVSGLDECTIYPIRVQWEDSEEWFTKDGKMCTEDKSPTLFWQPIVFDIPKKPKQKKTEKAWQWVYRNLTSGKYCLTYRCYATEEEATANLGVKDKVIEPYRPSEMEREVKE